MPSPPTRPGLGPWHVERPRLSARDDTSLLAVEAGSGYGKTSLAREIAFREGRALVEVGFGPADTGALGAVRRIAAALRTSALGTASRLADLATDDPGELADAVVDALASTPADDRVLVVFDDVHHLDEAGTAAVAGLVARIMAPHRPIVAGRHLAAPFLDLVPHRRPHLTGADLALTPSETVAVVEQGWRIALDAPTQRSLDDTCGGWPAAVVLAAPRLAAGRLGSSTPSARTGVVPNLLADLVGTLDDADVVALAQCARLPLVAPSLDRALGRPGLFERARTAGLPFLATEDGWWTLPDSVREHLEVYAPVDPDVLARVAKEYVRRDLAEHGASVLLDAGRADLAADLLAEIPPSRVDGLDLSAVQALVDRIPPTVLDRSPQILVHLARACIPAVAMHRRHDALERAGVSADPGSEVGRAVAAEQALDLVRDGRPDEATAIANRLLTECGSHEVVTRARAYDVLGRALAWQGESDADLLRAGEHLRTAAALAATADVRGIHAEVLLALGYAVEFPLGRLDAALEAMDAALVDVAARPRRRATIQTFRADVLHGLGRDDDATAALGEAATLARLLGDDRLAAYAAWEAAKGASRRGEHDRTLVLLDEVNRHRGPWFEHPTGMVFLADAAECCERIGERAQAASYLERAAAMMRDLLGEDDLSVWMARAGCAARSGDPADALAALDVVDRLPGLAPRERWRPIALRAMAVARRGDRVEATALARAALDAAADRGAALLPDHLEPKVAALLRDLVAGSGGDEVPAVRVEVLGGFTVRRSGEPVTGIPPGLTSALVKLLAVHGGRLHQDIVIEHLWPDGDPAGAGQRLRNVLHRLRDAGVVRRDGEMLALGPGTRVDLAEFTSLAGRALAAGPVAGAAVARQALAAYSGPLLPDDLYQDWTVAPRERARRTHLDVLDLLASEAEGRGADDVAIDHLQQALAVDPDSEHRAVRAADLLARAGRTVEALRVLDRAAAALAELGVQPSAEHRRIRTRLQPP